MQNKIVKTWFITGASKGLGLALVQQLLAAGQNVAATSRNAHALTTAVGTTSDKLLALETNLADDASVQEAIAKTAATFGTIDVLINNAGYGIGGSLEELSDDEVRAAFDINVFGTINTIRRVLPYMRQQRSGHIINISSIAGTAGATGWGAYSAAKAAVTALTEVLAEDVKALGIKATVVAPGAFRTSFLTEESLTMAKNHIEDYQTIRDSHARYAKMDGHQAGDPEKAAAIMIATGFNDNPPVHLFLGTDAYNRALTKLSTLTTEIESLKETSFSTDY